MGGSVLPGLGRFSTEKQESFLKLRSVYFISSRDAVRRVHGLGAVLGSNSWPAKCAPILIMYKD